MKTIASRDNPTFKRLRRWAQSSTARRDDGVALLEGVHLCDACLDAGRLPSVVVVGRRALERPDVAAVVDRLPDDARRDALLVDDALFDALSELAHGVGMLFVIDLPTSPPPGTIAADAVLLDRVQDPGNVGSILRSAAAAGIGAIHASAGCAGLWSPKVVRAAMGAHFHLALYDDCALASLEAAPGVARIATSSHADTTIHALDLGGPVAWLFGHEGGGVEPRLAAGATLARIPQPGRGESLNVAAAAAVCFFEQVRQRAGRRSGRRED